MDSMDPKLMPVLYSKIGSLTVQNDVLTMQLQDAQAEIARLQENNTPEGGE